MSVSQHIEFGPAPDLSILKYVHRNGPHVHTRVLVCAVVMLWPERHLTSRMWGSRA